MHIDDDRGDADGGRRRHQSIDAIHDAAMARNERAAILGAEAALQRRLGKVAGLRHEGQNGRRWPPA